jgi:threonine dehydrogenase-like Zn-dependent dehydrogenase
VLGSGTIVATSPMVIGYAVHAVRRAADGRWARAALLGAGVLGLPLVWLIPLMIAQLLGFVP